MRTPTNKTYQYSSIEDIFGFVTSENIDDFLIDFETMLRYSVLVKEIVEAMDLPQEDKVIDLSSFSWIDDGKHDGKFEVKATDGSETIVLEWEANVSQNISQDRIDALNKEQKREDRHPLTCGRCSSHCEAFLIPRDFSEDGTLKDGILIATPTGWVCPCGAYKQTIDNK